MSLHVASPPKQSDAGPKTFHLFPLLPWEIRNEIWNHAICRRRDGVHILQLYNNNYPQFLRYSGLEARSTFGQRRMFRHHKYERNIIVAPPLNGRKPDGASSTSVSSGTTTRPWMENNISSYTLDSGLWSACQESRRIMKSRHNRLSRMEPGAIRTLAIGASATDSNHQSRDKAVSLRPSISMLPHHDLFILQPHDFGTLPWQQVWRENLRHIALESDLLVASPTQLHNIFQAMFGAFKWRPGCLDSFWIVDYRIKRRQYVPTVKDDVRLSRTKTFTGNGCRFVDVTGKWTKRGLEDDMWYYPRGSVHAVNEDDVGPFLAIRMAKMFAQLSLSDFRDDNALIVNAAGDEVRFGILACEFF